MQTRMTAEEFLTGEYPEVKLRKKIQEFRALLRNASNTQVIKREFEKMFPEDK